MNDTYCKHCWPTKRRNHFTLHFDYYIDAFFACLSKPFKFLHKKVHICQDYFEEILIELLGFFNIVQFIDEPDASKLFNRSLIFFREAKNRNLNIKAITFLGKYVNEFKLIQNGKNYYYTGIPLKIFKEAGFDMDNKHSCKKILQENNLPTAPGRLFTNATKALAFGNEIGFPLVVKPCNGSLSHHVTCKITSEKELVNGIKIAKQYTPAFIVEKYVNGSLFRASVVGKSHVFVCQKDRANIVGDGHSTIKELIDLKNTQGNRGDTDQMDSTLHKIPINDDLIANLEKQELNLKTILPNNNKMYLQDKYILSQGCDIINCNRLVHAKNKELFIKVANILRSDLVGIDFICPDISKSYDEQETAILEVNSLPYIDMHQYPSHGDPEPVAEVVWDIVLKKLAEK